MTIEPHKKLFDMVIVASSYENHYMYMKYIHVLILKNTEKGDI